MRLTRIISVAAISLLLAATYSKADSVGTHVTGALNFSGLSTNWFDPVHGRVPAADLNAAGTTVTISSTATEFGYTDAGATLTADFTGTTLTVTEAITQFGSSPFQMTFTDPAFTSLSETSDNFPPDHNGRLISSLVGNTITLNFSGTSLNQTFVATYNVGAAAPLPPAASMGGLLLLGTLAVTACRRQKKSAPNA